MSQRTAVHGTFALERTYPAAPERVYRAFADPKAKAPNSSLPSRASSSTATTMPAAASAAPRACWISSRPR